jgi:hypothetical protein
MRFPLSTRYDRAARAALLPFPAGLEMFTRSATWSRTFRANVRGVGPRRIVTFADRHATGGRRARGPLAALRPWPFTGTACAPLPEGV